ncbi:helix-turn-helix domain-containing protein [Helicobacter sp. 23-1046]
MTILERINAILKAKNMTKRELANRIIALGYRANKTGEIPSESSIYAYLNGSIELKADLLPYIAESLNIYEQELFSAEAKSQKILQKLYRNDIEKYAEIIDLLEYVSPKTLETLQSVLRKNKTQTENFNTILVNYLA